MIAIANQPVSHESRSAAESAQPAWHEGFMKILPTVRKHAKYRFRHMSAEAREEAVQATIANAMAVYVRLFKQGKSNVAYAWVLARFAVGQVRLGRMVGGHMNINDVLSRHCQLKRGLVVDRLVRYDEKEEEWQEILVEDKTVTPAELAVSRLDFAAWLKTLSGQQLRVAKLLATGARTREAARKFGVSAARISHLRRELEYAWKVFQGTAWNLAPA